MIVPMKKVSLIVLGDKKDETLKKLRKSGMLHIDIANGSGARLNELNEQISLIEGSMYAFSKKDVKKAVQQNAAVDEVLEISQKIVSLSDKKKELSSKLNTLKSEIERLKYWGEISPDELKALSEKGINLSLYEIPEKEFKQLDDSVKTLVLGKAKSLVKCLIINPDDDIKQSVPDNFRVKIPQKSTEELKAELKYGEARIKDIDRELISFAKYSDSMKNAVKTLQKDVEFEVYSTGMSNENMSSNAEKEFTVSHFKGYIEADNLEKLKAEAKENKWGLLIEDPTEEDNVPTKLKNNKFVSLIYPLTDFLGTVPGYFEYDISGWFLGFILIFFGIIFGDGGYGLFILAIAAILIIKSLVYKKGIPPTFLLVSLFGLSTVLWGTLTCTWFGLSPEQLPEWLKSLSIPFISNVYSDKLWQPFWVSGNIGLTTAQNLQILCFSLALIQLTVAHIKGTARNIKSLKMLGDIGSILQLFGIYYLVLSLVVNADVFSFGLVIAGIPVGTVSIAMIAVGFLLSFIFSNYDGSIIKSVLSSMKNIVSVLLGVVNVFSDIVSYIRLWAVGLAGAAISATVNELAGPLLGNFMFMILAIILLVFGHGLNMILNILSVIVHGIRLNTLEFSSHLNMSWSGHKFKPFEE